MEISAVQLAAGVAGSDFDIVAIASSAGGFTALKQILAALPADFPAAIAIVQHLSSQSPGLLPHILSQVTPLRVKSAATGDALEAGIVYVAPPDRHLVSLASGFMLTQTERVNFTRPAADVLFASVAQTYGPRAIAVVLTGRGKDGAIGILAIKHMGGTTIAQDPWTADSPAMPRAAIQTLAVDRILPLHQIATTLVELVRGRG